MFLWNSSAVAANTIGELLKKPDVTLIEVLEDSSLAASLRSSLKELIAFITKDQILEELMGLALTEKYKDDEFKPKGNKLSRLALTVFINSSINFQQRILEKSIFVDGLNKFMECNVGDPFLIGHFQRIIETYSRSDCTFLEKFPTILDFLYNNISSLGILELLVFLMVEIQAFQSALDYEKIKPLVKLVGDTNSGYFAISAISKILKKNDKFRNLLLNDETLRMLLDAVISKDSNMLTVAAIFEVINDIFNGEDKSEIIDSYCKEYSFENNCALSGAIRIFKVIPIKVWEEVFQNEVSTFVLQSINEIFRKMSAEEQINILQQKIGDVTVLEKIMEFGSKTVEMYLTTETTECDLTTAKRAKSEGNIIELAMIISSLNDTELKGNEKWIDFCKNKLHPHIESRKEKYGGSTSTYGNNDGYFSTDDDEDDDENSSDDFDQSDDDDENSSDDFDRSDDDDE